MKVPLKSTRAVLNQMAKRYHDPSFLNLDPLEFVHRYTNPWDQEAVAVLAAVFAYGNVKQIRRSVQDALDRIRLLANSPRDFVQQLAEPAFEREARKSFGGWVHRFNRGQDVIELFLLMEKSWRTYGSLGSHFTRHLESEHTDIGRALSAMISDWRGWRDRLKSKSETFDYLLTSPADGSCCKRWCMLLRWLGRKDSLDIGLWTRQGAMAESFSPGKFLRADQLVMPLDTHSGTLSRELGLTARRTLNWKAAVEVTQALKRFDSQDPTRFDFSMVRHGMLSRSDRK